MEPKIIIEHLSYLFGQKEILHDLNLGIESGAFYAVLGANGCGKTTLLRCAAGLLAPQQGSVRIAAGATPRPVLDFSARERAQQIATVRQQAQTDFEFSAFEIVLMGRNPYQHHLQNESQADWDIVEQSMKQTHTWHLRLAHPNEMSGGELQRVMIARALAQQTPILLLDEPTSNLDIAHQFDVMELLRDISRNEHKTILLVVHDLNLAMHYCPQSILLHNTGVLSQGPTPQVLTPNNIQTAFGVRATPLNGHLRFEPLR